jgi:hypothetical protein
MIYLNANLLGSPQTKSFLSHEFMHLITFNQKDKTYGVSEEIWLNEARSEYVPTLLGYDEEYQGSTLQMRVEKFIEEPNDSLTEWLNSPYDYGVINLFTQYLVDHYGVKILIDSLHSEKVGIPSINEALKKNGVRHDFSQIFTDWTIAVLINDCQLDLKYCYLNENLKDIKVIPASNFLPLVGESTLSVTRATVNWAGNWQKIFGGKENLKFSFDGSDLVKFKVPYLLCQDLKSCEVKYLALDENQKGDIEILKFSEKYSSLIVIPSVQSKIIGFNGAEPSYSFSWTVSTFEKTEEEKEKELIEKLLAQIEFLKAEIVKVQAKINAILASRGQLVSCQKFENNLYFGMRNNSEVKCLQEFLRAQGPEIYPEGLVTGNFLSLTQAAVIRFQERYASEILAPWELKKGTGFVGRTTRLKINELLK